MLRLSALVSVALVWLVTGCGSDGDDDSDSAHVTVSCTAQDRSECVEITLPRDATSGIDCGSGATLGLACSHDGLSGVCTRQMGQVVDRLFLYGRDAASIADSKEGCERSGGTWSTKP